jgi:hypothetical protein
VLAARVGELVEERLAQGDLRLKPGRMVDQVVHLVGIAGQIVELLHVVGRRLANGRTNSGCIVDDKAYGAYTFQLLGSRLKPGCAVQGIADGLTELIGQYIAR